MDKKDGILPKMRTMADGVRFELTEDVNLRRFSRPLHSTALPSVRLKTESIIYEFFL